MINKEFLKIHNELKQEFPRSYKLVEKEKSKLMKVLYYVSLMFLWNKSFLKTYTATIISRVYMPREKIGTLNGAIILRHERVHIRDCFKTGILPFIVSYLFLLPTILTLRAYWEYRGYRESLVAWYEYYGDNYGLPEEVIDRYVKEFTSSKYLFMFPFRKTIKNLFLNKRREIIPKEHN